MTREEAVREVMSQRFSEQCAEAIVALFEIADTDLSLAATVAVVARDVAVARQLPLSQVITSALTLINNSGKQPTGEPTMKGGDMNAR